MHPTGRQLRDDPTAPPRAPFPENILRTSTPPVPSNASRKPRKLDDLDAPRPIYGGPNWFRSVSGIYRDISPPCAETTHPHPHDGGLPIGRLAKPTPCLRQNSRAGQQTGPPSADCCSSTKDAAASYQ
jgi:hypothetical protein